MGEVLMCLFFMFRGTLVQGERKITEALAVCTARAWWFEWIAKASICPLCRTNGRGEEASARGHQPPYLGATGGYFGGGYV